ncbi:MAG: HAD-IIIC family phosphatase [Planctomycetota bacterium]
MSSAGRPEPSPPSREAIDEAIARALQDADAARPAQHALNAFWRSNPAAAPWVAGRFQKLAAALGAPTLDLLVLRSVTLEPVAPLARACAAEFGVDLRIRFGEFNAWTQELLDPRSIAYADPAPQAVVLAVQTRDIAPILWSGAAGLSRDDALAEADRVASELASLIRTFRDRSAAHLVVHTLEQPAWPTLGVALESRDGTHARQAEAIGRINDRLRAAAAEVPGVHVLDYDALVARHGRERWHDEDKFLTMRMPLAADALLPLAREWSRFLLPIAGRQSKCLVLDLDNTLWGGIVGEDGPDGIQLGVEHPGAHYVAIQRAALDLYHRGVVLALCSKNNPGDADEVLRSHPHMLIRPEHLAAVRVNWTDKAQNLREIAAELNIGVDSLVFLDDNPVERELVRTLAPEVMVLEPASADPKHMLRAIRECPLFERLALSDDDRSRGRMYVEQRQRTELQSAATSLEDYWRSLAMVAEVGIVDETTDSATVERIAQLTQKTNQLNMTTKRYSTQDVQAFARDGDSSVYWIRVADRFGDNGIVGVVIARIEGDAWHLDTLLMSCRVIGRTVETCMLATVAEHARDAGASRLEGWFYPTKKNPPARAIYEDHGFEVIRGTDGGALWSRDITGDDLQNPEWIERRLIAGAAQTA